MKLTFAGAADTVTGSRYLLDTGERRLLVDCGLFQGFKVLRERNWAAFPVSPRRIDTVLLTHAHLDHSGYLPALVRDGFRGAVLATEATRELAELLLLDSAKLQEEEADFANRHGYSRHAPAEPLYTVRDAERAIERFEVVEFGDDVSLGGGLKARFLPAGHLLGASIVQLRRGKRSLVFSGDLGRPHDLVMRPPVAVDAADTLVVESTYGDRRHEATDPEQVLGEIVRETAHRGGTVLIPSFAVGRSQSVMFSLWRLKQRGEIPDIPVFLDSPMAIDATRIYRRYRRFHRLTLAECEGMFRSVKMVNTAEESKALARLRVPAVIIAASGMATGGRVLHHLKIYAPDPACHIVFAGFQVSGTRGAHMVEGASEVKIHGEWVPVRARVTGLEGYSAHADADEVLAWMRRLRTPPSQVYVTHGEPEASDQLRVRIAKELGWRARVPEHLESVEVPL